MKALEDQNEGQRINAFAAVKVKTESKVNTRDERTEKSAERDLMSK